MSTKAPKPKKIRARFGLTKLPDGTIGHLLEASLKGLTDNATIYPKLPVDLKTYQAGIAAYQATIPAALDGGKTAVAQKNKLRDVAVRMYTQNAHYVEANCNDDMATFLLSGFQPASPRTPSQPLAQPTIASVVEGHVSGGLKVKIGPVRKALTYDLRYGVVPNGGGTPASWTEKTITDTRAVVITGLTPGTTYAFQVRAYGRLGHTDWSATVTHVAT